MFPRLGVGVRGVFRLRAVTKGGVIMRTLTSLVDAIADAMNELSSLFDDPSTLTFDSTRADMERLEKSLNQKGLVDASFAYLCERDGAGRSVGATYAPTTTLKRPSTFRAPKLPAGSSAGGICSRPLQMMRSRSRPSTLALPRIGAKPPIPANSRRRRVMTRAASGPTSRQPLTTNCAPCRRRPRRSVPPSSPRPLRKPLGAA